jgi:hypothetical protein
MLQTTAKLLSSLLPKEVTVLRTDKKANAIVEKNIGPKIIQSHHVHGNQNNGQTNKLGLPCVPKYP